ncbi:MAG: hypothetical protein HGA61_04635 [Candidatus Moranbacteria bacterium]|nr:hypothetical protein [Candidatus Moranbacteria bacterium]
MDEQTTNDIKTIIEDILKNMGFSGTIFAVEGQEEEIIYEISIDSDSSHLLIGQYGVNLQAFQHIARLIVRKKFPEKIHFSIDINDYRKQKNNSVIEAAIQVAKEAIEKHQPMTMKPMSTYERRIVHLELSKNPNVTTESIGEGENRKIFIKPA